MLEAAGKTRTTLCRCTTSLGLALLAASLVPGCGGNGGGGGPTQPGTPMRTVLFQDGWTLDALEFQPLVGDVNVSGTLDITVQWTHATNDVDVFVTTDACSDEQFALAQCDFLARAASTTAKPEQVSLGVTARAYTIWVLNFGPGRESGTIDVGITPS